MPSQLLRQCLGLRVYLSSLNYSRLESAKATAAAAAMDDSVEMKRKLEMIGDMPAVDMTMAEREASVRDFQVDDDDEEANKMDSGTEKSDEACRFYGRR